MFDLLIISNDCYLIFEHLAPGLICIFNSVLRERREISCLRQNYALSGIFNNNNNNNNNNKQINKLIDKICFLISPLFQTLYFYE